MIAPRYLRAWQLFLAPLYIAISFAVGYLNSTARAGMQPASDQFRYRRFAENLAAGEYTWSTAPDLTNGPGYPFVLLPFAALDAPWWMASLLNVIFVLMTFGFVWKALALYVSQQAALMGALFVGFYPPLLLLLPYQMTEPFAAFLAAGFTFFACSALAPPPEQRIPWPVLLAAGGFLGVLALTKAIFGYVITVGLVIALSCFVHPATRSSARRPFLILALAMVVCVPWLAYTHSVTGKFFYWSSSGGENLYWMTTPHSREYGEWHSPSEVYSNPGLNKNHGDLYRTLARKPRVERGRVLTGLAIDNVREHPAKYLTNVVSNIGRLLFNYPHSYKAQTPNTLLYIASNMFLVVPGVIAVALLLWRVATWRARSDEVMIGGLFLIAFGGSSLVSATPRYFIMMVPLAVVLLAQSTRESRLLDWIRR